MPDRPYLDYAPPVPLSIGVTFWGGVGALILSIMCLAARLFREAGWLDGFTPLRRIAGNPITSASLGFALLAGVLASILRVQIERGDVNARRRGKRKFAMILGLAIAIATLSGFILL